MPDLKRSFFISLLLSGLLLAGCKTGHGPVAKVTPLPAATPVPKPKVTPLPATPPKPLVQTPPPVPLPPITNPAPERVWIPIESWSEAHGLGIPHRGGNSTNQVYKLQGITNTLTITIGSRVAIWDGLFVWLGFAPQITNSEPCFNTLDVKKSLAPLLTNQLDLASISRTIVIDPGHGGQNNGTRSVIGDHFEKEYTLDWAKRLKPLLEMGGWTVFLTRDHDMDLSLAERVEFAETHSADLFISLHFNSSFPRQEAAGIETYCLTPFSMPSNLIREGEDDPTQSYPNNHYDEQNLELALRLHRELLDITHASDRGIRRARFMGVLRGQNRPAVLIEGGYLSNPAEARLIAAPSYRQKLAEAVAKALE